MTRIASIAAVLLLSIVSSSAAALIDVKAFNPNTAMSIRVLIWTHQIPIGNDVGSATIGIESKLYSSGLAPLRLLASESTEFGYNNPSSIVGTVNRATNPSSASFYTAVFSLNDVQLDWLRKDRSINFMLDSPPVFPPNTYYLKSSMLTAQAVVPLPATAWLLLSALAAMGFVGRRQAS